ncbi:MAG: HAMP domain-containing protein [Phycisphaerales bacterium]|nr:HAMP domain-containing protein [Phycisphaerales bacterium]
MAVRRNSWRALLATTVVIASTVAAAFWLGLGAATLWPESPVTMILLAVVTVAAIVAMTAIHTRRLRRLLRLVAQTARRLSSGDSTARIEADGTPELDLLSRAMEKMRGRLTGQIRSMDNQRQTFASLLDQLREGVVVVDDDGRVAIINPAAVELLGLTPPKGPATFVGMAVEQCFPQMEIQRLLAPTGGGEGAALSLDGGRPERRLELEIAGGTRHLLVHASEIVLPDGETAEGEPKTAHGRVLVVTDITALTRNIEMKTDFVTNASHELRTPLTTIRAAVETLQQLDLDGAGGVKRWVEMIQRQSDRLISLASDLLDLSRVESALSGFKPRSIDIRQFVEEVRNNFSEKLAARRVRLIADTSGCTRASFVADPQLLRLIVDNLVDNAIKFTDAGKEVRIAVRTDVRFVALSVIDEGCGISPEDQERVFERFYQVERARTGIERGSGLGLSIVRHAVATMDGTVALESELGKGTTVTVTIPQPGMAAVA